MEIKILCQSCGIPLDKETIKGSEKNDLKNEEYCKFCYDQGGYTNPNLTLDELKETVQIQMKKMKLPDHAIDDALNILPNLNRWKVN